MFNMFAQSDYIKKLEKYNNKNKSALDLGKTVCQRCGQCCFRRTCMVPPKELQNVADVLKMTVKDMILTYMIVDYNNNIPMHLKWANENQMHLTGTLIDSSDTFISGQCIMYDKEKKECKIFDVLDKNKMSICNNCWEEKEIDLSCGWKDGDIDKFEYLDLDE